MFLRISGRSAPVPILLLIGEFLLASAALLIAAHFQISSHSSPADLLGAWLLRAVLFSTLVLLCMVQLRLYTPDICRRKLASLLRLLLAVSMAILFCFGFGVWIPALHVLPSVLFGAGCVCFLLIGSLRPVFMEGICDRQHASAHDWLIESQRVLLPDDELSVSANKARDLSN